MCAASALSNLAGRLATVCGLLILGVTWSFFTGPSARMLVGILLIDGAATLMLVCVWAALRDRARRIQVDLPSSNMGRCGKPARPSGWRRVDRERGREGARERQGDAAINTHTVVLFVHVTGAIGYFVG